MVAIRTTIHGSISHFIDDILTWQVEITMESSSTQYIDGKCCLFTDRDKLLPKLFASNDSKREFYVAAKQSSGMKYDFEQFEFHY
jgi:predicted ribosome-associated RNA-binding protein Tma20